MAAEFKPSVNMYLPPRRGGPLLLYAEPVARYLEGVAGLGLEGGALPVLSASLVETMARAEASTPSSKRRRGTRSARTAFHEGVLTVWGWGEEPPGSGEALVDVARGGFGAGEDAEFAARVMLCAAAARAGGRGAAAVAGRDCALGGSE